MTASLSRRRQYENEDGIDFTGLKVMSAGLRSYDAPLALAERNGGSDHRHVQPNDPGARDPHLAE